MPLKYSFSPHLVVGGGWYMAQQNPLGRPEFSWRQSSLQVPGPFQSCPADGPRAPFPTRLAQSARWGRAGHLRATLKDFGRRSPRACGRPPERPSLPGSWEQRGSAMGAAPGSGLTSGGRRRVPACDSRHRRLWPGVADVLQDPVRPGTVHSTGLSLSGQCVRVDPGTALSGGYPRGEV